MIINFASVLEGPVGDVVRPWVFPVGAFLDSIPNFILGEEFAVVGVGSSEGRHRGVDLDIKATWVCRSSKLVFHSVFK
jgi:hypothetical protein